MAVLCGMPTIQYSARIARLYVRLSKWVWPDDLIRPRLASDVAENLGELSSTECTYHGIDFELIPTVKVENRLPVEDHW